MATPNTITGQIRKIALEVLAERPDGIRYSDIKRKVLEHIPSFNTNTISGATWDLEITYADLIYKPDRGVFRLLKFKEEILTQPDQPNTVETKTTKRKSIKEEDCITSNQSVLK
jgi:hypothetical protein